MPDIELSAGTIHYRDSVGGPPIDFARGILVNATLFQQIIGPLEAKFRCVAPGLPLRAHPKPGHPDADLTPRGPFIAERGVRGDIGKFPRAVDNHDTLRAAERFRGFTKPDSYTYLLTAEHGAHRARCGGRQPNTKPRGGHRKWDPESLLRDAWPGHPAQAQFGIGSRCCGTRSRLMAR